MAKVILYGRDNIEASREKLMPLFKKWSKGELDEDQHVSLEGLGVGFKAGRVDGFEGMSEISGGKGTEEEYDLDNPQDKKIVKDFEREFEEWSKDKDYEPIELVDRFYEYKGAYKLDEETYKDSPGWEEGDYKVIVRDIDLYQDIEAKWQALGKLKDRRAYMRAQDEDEDIDKIREEQAQKINPDELFEKI